jgi:ABC-type Fe3+/spermidine/putrescine transport system ATPase subunit
VWSTRFVADFIGAVNLVPATVESLGDGRASVSFGQRRASIRVPDGLAVSTGSAVHLCIRPEALALLPPGSHAEGRTLAGKVARKAFLGDLMRYWVTVDGREWIVDQPDPGAAQLLDGDVTLEIREERVHLIAD